MTRLIGPSDRTVFLTEGINKGKAAGQGMSVPLYADEGLTVPADVRSLAGDVIAGTPPTLTVDDYSQIPLFRYPDGVDVVYTSISGGPATPLYARPDDRLDALTAALFPVTAAGSQLPAASNVTVVDESGSPRPIDYFDGYLWGTGSAGQIYRSADAGSTWTQVGTAPVRLIRIAAASDGEMIGVGSTAVYRSVGWSTDSSTATWSERTAVSPGTSQYQHFGFSGQDQKWILTEYSSANRADSRWVKISLDDGVTWTIAWDTNAQFPATYAESHLHAACYDPWEDRFWFTEGHGTPKGAYYSDDDGATWTRLTGGVADTMEPMPTVMVATDDGICCGTDAPTYGVFGIRRTDDPADLQMQPLWRWQTVKDGVVGFGTVGWRDPRDGLVYISFYAGLADVKPVVAVGTASGAALAWTASDGGVESRVWGAWVTDDDTFVAHTATASNATQRRATGRIRRPGTAVGNLPDGGNVLTGDAGGVNTAVAVGTGATTNARQHCVSVGNLASAGSGADGKATAIGYSATALDRGTAIGDRAAVSATDSVAVGSTAAAATSGVAVGQAASASGTGATALGKSTVASATNTVAIGLDTTAVGSSSTSVGVSADATGIGAVALGASAQATGNQSVSIGQTATASQPEAVALGRNASSTQAEATALGDTAAVNAAQGTAVGANSTVSSGNTGSVALGYGTATTASKQVQVGDRHFELAELSADPAAPAADRARLFTKDNGSGKTGLYVRFPTGAVQQIAIEP